MSHDVAPEQATEEVKEATPVVEKYIEPLMREEREELNALSLKVYGRRLEWQSVLRKGELRPETAQTANGETITIKRLHHLTVNDVALKMEKILTEREEQAKKAAEEAALKAQGENNGEEQKTGEVQEAVSQPSIENG